ncbi:hypothetical protein C2R22_06110 [Salinigranum rubrum]|uniref:DUF7260 domain-containing protein n=1 Tax=Salinigranum rubrum TaxID=755307 RepID=A0A2I8VH90_9EURY|nr:hypothetical protein [Salinigranum rubrum]AUV81291.1 hypothetical protein C2R22_06110 [Salinigranum rubrum]
MALTLTEAREVVEAERRECVAERDAFERFRTAVTRADAGGGASMTGTSTFGVGAGPTAARGVPGVETSARGVTGTSLRRSYRRHVMAAGGGTDESLSDHVAAELGPDLAAVVCRGTLTPATRRGLLDRVDIAVDARESFVALLDRERASLDAVEAVCRRVRSEGRRTRTWESTSRGADAPLGAALTAWDRLDDLAAALDEGARDRQETLARHRRSFAVVDDDVTGYLYGCRPGLAAIASVGEDLSAARRAVVRAVGGGAR